MGRDKQSIEEMMQGLPQEEVVDEVLRTWQNGLIVAQGNIPLENTEPVR